MLEHLTREGHAVLADFELHQQHHLASSSVAAEPCTPWQQAQRDAWGQPQGGSGTAGIVAEGGTQQPGSGDDLGLGGAESGEGVQTASAPAPQHAQQGQHGCGRHSVGDCPPGVVLRILSDIDDTLFCSGGAFPAGTDKRYPK